MHQQPIRKDLRKRLAELQSTYENRHGEGKKEYGGTQRKMLICEGPAPKRCQWLYGEPKIRDFCDARTQYDSPYCEHHHKICYVKQKPLTES